VQDENIYKTTVSYGFDVKEKSSKKKKEKSHLIPKENLVFSIA